MSHRPIHGTRLLWLLLATIVSLHLCMGVSRGGIAASTAITSPTPSTQPISTDGAAKADAIAIASARRDMLKAIDARIASLQGLIAQLPAEERSQSSLAERLKQAIADKARIEAASDDEIASRIAAGTSNANRTSGPATNPTPAMAIRHAPTSEPILLSLETQLVFPGSQSQGQPGAQVRPPAGCELLDLHATDGTNIAALFGHRMASDQACPPTTLLFFYGNGMCMADCLGIFDHLRSLGFNVILADYEGYGMSGGKPSEAGCYAAADAAYDWLLRRGDVDASRIVAVGWSLGGAVAIDLASRKRVAGLATFSAFTSIRDMGSVIARGMPVAMLLRSRFDNVAKMPLVSCPIFMAHGSQDQIVPPDMLTRLASAAKSRVTVVNIPGAGHNDLFQRGGDVLYDRFRQFVDGLADVLPTTRPA